MKRTFKNYITEYNKSGTITDLLSKEQVSVLLPNSNLVELSHITSLEPDLRHFVIFRHDNSSTNRYYILSERKTHEIGGYIRIEKVKSSMPNVWQEKEAVSFIKGAGLITELYPIIVYREKLKLINDYTLSTSAEKMWNRIISHSANGANVKIYDKINDKIYNLSDIGKEIDGILVKNPKDAVVDILNIPKSFDEMQFFFIAENIKAENYIYLKEDYSEDVQNYHRWLLDDPTLENWKVSTLKRTMCFTEVGDI